MSALHTHMGLSGGPSHCDPIESQEVEINLYVLPSFWVQTGSFEDVFHMDPNDQINW